MRRTAERTTLSPMTSTVTVAPLTMSTWGGRSAPVATGFMSLPTRVFTASTMRRSGMPTRTMGSLWSTSLIPRDDAVRIDADQEVDRLAGIADGAGEVGVQVDVAEQAVALVGGNERRIALRRVRSGRLREELGGLCLREELLHASCRHAGARSQKRSIRSSKQRQNPQKRGISIRRMSGRIAGERDFSNRGPSRMRFVLLNRKTLNGPGTDRFRRRVLRFFRGR